MQLEPDQIAAIADATAIEFRPMVYLGAMLGLRWSEIAYAQATSAADKAAADLSEPLSDSRGMKRRRRSAEARGAPVTSTFRSGGDGT